MKRWILILGLIVVLGIAAFTAWQQIPSQTVKDTGTEQLQDQVDSTSPAVASNFAYNCEPGKSVFDVLETKAEIEYSESSFGKLVTAINNSKQGDNKYWLYSIDGKEATVGATAFICQGSEEVKWELK